jgi:hypothetical protein
MTVAKNDRAHPCPHCRCLPDPVFHGMGHINRDAPFYPLVELVDQLAATGYVDPRRRSPRDQAS